MNANAFFTPGVLAVVLLGSGFFFDFFASNFGAWHNNLIR